MPIFPVTIEKERALAERMQRLGVREQDLDESFVRSSGPGGQNVNKASTCVVLVHRPSGIAVRCQEARSQGLNRFLARRLLLDRIEDRTEAARSAARQRVEKIRRQKRKRNKRAQEKMLAAKHRQAEKKAGRRQSWSSEG